MARAAHCRRAHVRTGAVSKCRQRAPQLPRICAALCLPAEVYQGKFGPWTIEPEDVTEVWAYRVGITVATTGALNRSLCTRTQHQVTCLCTRRKRPPRQVAVRDIAQTDARLCRSGMCTCLPVSFAAFVVGSVPALLPDGLGSAALQALEPALNPLTLMGAGGLGASLFLIHIYMDPLKKALQVWL